MRSAKNVVINRCASTQQRLYTPCATTNALLSSVSSSSNSSNSSNLITNLSNGCNHSQHQSCISSNSGSNLNRQSKRSYSVRLAEVGRFESCQEDKNLYPPGQPFLHRIFGYRGVTLFPWLAQVHDLDLRKQSIGGNYETNNENVNNNNINNNCFSHQESHRHSGNRILRDRSNTITNESGNSDEVNYIGQNTDDSNNSVNNANDSNNQHQANTNRATSQIHPYYQVLIDTRDCPYVSNRTQTEAVTFLGHPDNSKSVYSIKGLDYVAHEDILPYTSYEDTPICHELHTKLFKYNPEFVKKGAGKKVPISKFMPSDLLDEWRSKHPWLELSKVYRETTENIRVTVIPFYLGHTTIEDTSFHWWRYCVRLENFSDCNVQLRERHWKIFSQTNMLQTIKGRGVVGVEPLFTKSDPAYQYSSHVNLQDKSGHMWGTFKMQRVEDGRTFDCKIPTFSLESSFSSSSDNKKYV